MRGIHAATRGTRFQALEPIKQGVREYCGDFAPLAPQALTLRHDHGSQFMSHDFQEELAFLGIESSPAFVRAPEGNGCAERLVRIPKEQLIPKPRISFVLARRWWPRGPFCQSRKFPSSQR